MTDEGDLTGVLVKRTTDGAAFETKYHDPENLKLESLTPADDRHFTLEHFVDRLRHGGYYIPDLRADADFRDAADDVLGEDNET